MLTNKLTDWDGCIQNKKSKKKERSTRRKWKKQQTSSPEVETFAAKYALSTGRTQAIRKIKIKVSEASRATCTLWKVA